MQTDQDKTVKLIVSSENPVKINAVKLGYEKMFPEAKCEAVGVKVPSGVPDQPVGVDETYQGALNRANNAREAQPDGDFWFGLEGGVTHFRGEMYTFGWVVVIDRSGKIGKGRTGGVFLPAEIAKLVESGIELGTADDMFFKGQNTKQNAGTIGILTDNIITRTDAFIDAVVISLVQFKHPEYFSN